jgi:heat shock protein HslJ
MKENGKVNLLTIALVLGLFLASCGQTNGTGEELSKDPLAGTEWQLVSYGDPDEPTAVIQVRIPTISFEEGEVGGSGSCNSYGGSYSVEGERLQFGEMAWTEMACGEVGVMDQETAFLSILTAVESFDLSDGSLTLSGPGGTLRFELPPPPEPQTLEGVLWQLEHFLRIEGDGVDVEVVERPLEGYPITALFEEGAISGSTGCNNYWGMFTLEGDRIQIQEVEVTEEYCGEAGVMEQEDAFLDILNAVESFELTDDTLTLISPEGNLVFGLPSTPGTQPIEGVLWQLERFVSIEGDVVAAEAALERFPITAFFGEGQLNGTTGCNNYGAAYTIDGERIEFPDAFFMTQAECLEERASQQEARFMQSIQAVQSFRVADDALILAFPGGELIFRSQPDPGTGENAVYEALLADWGAGPFVIRDQTAFNAPDVSLEDTLEFVQEQLRNMGGEDPFTLQDETLEDFRAKNAEAASLGGKLQTRFSTTVLTEAELQERFGEDGEFDWVEFEGEFPGTEGIYSLSQVGFNPDGDQALVYLGLQSEDFTGGWYSLMVKDRGRWMATISFMIWEE